MRVVVIGGYGNFGARVCRGLAGSPGMEVVAAGRRPRDGGGQLDISAPGFAGDLAKLAPDLVIHCAGPFQSQDFASRSPRWLPARITSISPTAGSSSSVSRRPCVLPRSPRSVSRSPARVRFPRFPRR
jgi:NAD(P)-dependent dehydrogenase (short-subunit alcohol dehydrogenase family)